MYGVTWSLRLCSLCFSAAKHAAFRSNEDIAKKDQGRLYVGFDSGSWTCEAGLAKFAKPRMLILINKRFVLGRKIGHGGCGDVYEAHLRSPDETPETDTSTIEKPFAIKLEKLKNRNLLQHEVNVLRELQACDFVSKVHWFGEEGDFRILVMDRLGRDLDYLLHLEGGTFDLRTTVLLGMEMVTFFLKMELANFFFTCSSKSFEDFIMQVTFIET